MNRRNVNEMVTNMVARQYPNLQQAKRNMVINNVSKSIRKDYYILDLNLKSETKRRINNEVKRSMGNIL